MWMVWGVVSYLCNLFNEHMKRSIDNIIEYTKIENGAELVNNANKIHTDWFDCTYYWKEEDVFPFMYSRMVDGVLCFYISHDA